MNYFDKLLFFYSYIVDEAFDLNENFNLKQAKLLRKSILQKDKQVKKLIRDYNSSLELIEFNSSQESKETILHQLKVMTEIVKFNDTVLAIDVISPKGYYMFIKDIIAYSHLLP